MRSSFARAIPPRRGDTMPAIFVGFIAGIHALIVSANRDGESRRLSPLFWVLLSAFLGMLALWVVAITTHDRWVWPR